MDHHHQLAVQEIDQFIREFNDPDFLNNVIAIDEDHLRVNTLEDKWFDIYISSHGWQITQPPAAAAATFETSHAMLCTISPQFRIAWNEKLVQAVRDRLV